MINFLILNFSKMTYALKLLGNSFKVTNDIKSYFYAFKFINFFNVLIFKYITTLINLTKIWLIVIIDLHYKLKNF